MPLGTSDRDGADREVRPHGARRAASVGEREADTATRQFRGRLMSAALVGCDAALALLNTALHRAVDGESASVLVGGEAG